jgi:hypothetical protein
VVEDGDSSFLGKVGNNFQEDAITRKTPFYFFSAVETLDSYALGDRFDGVVVHVASTYLRNVL